MNIFVFTVAIVIGYLIGSVNPAIIYSRLKGTDIRSVGSKNAGATNTLRNFGKKAALIVTVCDLLKCVIAVILAAFLASVLDENVLLAKLFAATGCIIGHNFPVYFGFKGGKGVLVSVAALFMSDWRVGLSALGVFIVVFAIWKYVSLGSISGAAAAIIAAFLTRNIPVIIFTVFAAALTIYRHKTNIVRLVNGTEAKTAFSSNKEK